MIHDGGYERREAADSLQRSIDNSFLWSFSKTWMQMKWPEADIGYWHRSDCVGLNQQRNRLERWCLKSDCPNQRTIACHTLHVQRFGSSS